MCDFFVVTCRPFSNRKLCSYLLLESVLQWVAVCFVVCVAVFCSVLQCVAVCCSVLQWCRISKLSDALFEAYQSGNILQHAATQTGLFAAHMSSSQKHTATRCNMLQLTATHCNTNRNIGSAFEQLTATHCSLQCTVTHCNTLQHTASHCNSPQHAATNNIKQDYLRRVLVN